MDADSVLLYTKLFIDSLRKTKNDPSNAAFRTETFARRALVFATRAQQHLAHSALMEQEMKAQFKSKLQKVKSIGATATQMSSSESRKEWAVKVLSAIELAPPLQTETEGRGVGVKVEGEGEDDDEDEAYDPNKDLDADAKENEEEALIHDEIEEKDDMTLTQRWMAKVAKMSDAVLTSPRIEAIMSVCNEIKSKNKDERIVMFSKYVKFLDMIAGRS